MDTLTSTNLTSDWFTCTFSRTPIYIRGGSTWAGAMVQVEVEPPWANPLPIADVRYSYTADAVDVLEIAAGDRFRFVASGGSGAESIQVAAKGW